MSSPHLTRRQLSERWHKSIRTLERWADTGEGPRFLRAGRSVLYPIAEVERWEAAHLFEHRAHEISTQAESTL
jgi:hypothetical protein